MLLYQMLDKWKTIFAFSFLWAYARRPIFDNKYFPTAGILTQGGFDEIYFWHNVLDQWAINQPII